MNSNVEPDEVEEIFVDFHIIRKTRQGKRVAYGQTLDGRYLFVVFAYRDSRIYPITARDMKKQVRKTILPKEATVNMNSSKKFNPVPQFKTLQEEADFWDTHDSMEYELEYTDEMVELSDEQKAQIRERWEKRKRATIQLNPEQLNAVEIIAKRKQVDYRELIHEWVNLHIADEFESSTTSIS